MNEKSVQRYVAARLLCIHTALEIFNKYGSYKDLNRSGRPKQTFPRDDLMIKRIAVRSPKSSLKKNCAALLGKGTDVHITTVSRRLRFEFCLKSYKPARKPRLTSLMKSKRLAFAKEHAAWSAEDWSKIMFSDECTLQQFAVRKKNVRRPVGKRFEERYTVSTMKHPLSQMVWGAFSKSGTAGLKFLPPGTAMNGSRYVDLLKEKLEMHMNIHRCTVFMHDGAPCHRLKVVKQFLFEKGVATLGWPENNLDLNPIENL